VELTVPLGPLEIAVSGAIVSTVQLRVAGVGSALPTASAARTEKVCGPSARPEYDFGDVHAAHAPASSLHSKPAPDSGDENANDAELDATVPAGPLESEVSGATVSTVHVLVAGEASTLPDESVARTENVCAPCARDA
jgi:hypothetical protein